MKRTHILPALLCAAILTLGLASPTLAYSDVGERAWYYDEVQQVTTLGLMQGVSSDRFALGDTVTRATAITVLWRLEGSPAAKEEGQAFSDLPESHWAYRAGAWAKEQGIATGYAGGRFDPGGSVTREQLAAFLFRYDKMKGKEITEGVVEQYDDAKYISPWALESVKHALGSGLMTGAGKDLSPLGLATRAQLAAILVRLTTPVQG